MFPVPWSSRWSWSLHLFLSRPMFLRPFGLYCSACFGSLFMSILCTCCSHFFWYCLISFVMFCAPVFFLIHWIFSLSTYVIPSKCLSTAPTTLSRLSTVVLRSGPAAHQADSNTRGWSDAPPHRRIDIYRADQSFTNRQGSLTTPPAAGLHYSATIRPAPNCTTNYKR